jgi:nitroimidazol reductase NimA-like FMN-containing flavoprotein (pyridoxamine 5'-phosphate oxidase superfamily)
LNRRDAIKMTDEEALAFLEEQKTVICATNGHDGFPHLMPLWYVVRTQPTSSAGTGTGTLWAWTYAKAQKTKNLERDPRATLQVEAGETYDQLRGLMLRTEAVLHHDDEVKEAFVAELAERYAPPGVEPAAVRDGFRTQIPKRVAIEFAERSRVSWDHRKLGGTY